VRNADAERELTHDAVGNAAATELRRCTGTKGPTAISDFVAFIHRPGCATT
jgi:hypothetical protein